MTCEHCGGEGVLYSELASRGEAPYTCPHCHTGGGMMTVDQALVDCLCNSLDRSCIGGEKAQILERLAPIIERALRAAYRAGFTDGKAVYEWISDANAPGGCPRCRTENMTTVHINSEQRERCGVTAGVAAMTEES